MPFARPGVLFLLVLVMAASAAAEDLQKITVDLADQTIVAGVPFDEPFILTGTVNAAVQRLTLTVYDVTDEVCRAAKKGTITVTSTDACERKPTGNPIASTQEWNRRVGGNDNFQFTLPALDAYACYSLEFTQFLQPATEPQRNELKKQLAEQLRDELKDIHSSALADDQVNALEQRLCKTAQEFVRTKFQACLPCDAVNVRDGAAGESRVALRLALERDEKFDSNQSTLVTPTSKALCLSESDCEEGDKTRCDDETCTNTDACWTEFLRRLNAVLVKPDLLAEGPKKWWEQPLNAGREATKTVTLGQAAAAFVAAYERGTLAEVLGGTSRIAGPVLETTTAPDPPSLDLLSDFFKVLSSRFFVLQTGQRVLPRGLAECQVNLDSGFRQLANLYRENVTTQATLQSPTFTDVLAESLVSQEFRKTASPTIITEQKNPYISLDVGVAYGFELDKAFPYYGANFYFVPVNKKAPLSRFEGRERVLKSFSLLLGVTGGSFEDSRTKKFFSAGSVMLGAGWRFNQFVKVNGGALLFKQVDPNPIVVVEHKKAVPFVSFSIDIDLRTLLGTNIGNIFQ